MARESAGLEGLAAAKQLHGLLEKNQAEMLASRSWEERRLAFPVKGHKKGLYYLTYFRCEGGNLVNIERDCALNEMILRMLVLRVDPKLVEAMLAMARDEHGPGAVHLQTVNEPPPDEDALGEGEGDDRHRRGGRRLAEVKD